jgi:uncharacterized protein (UPF0147 family)
MTSTQLLDNVFDLLLEITEDNTIPKNVKKKMSEVMGILKQDVDISIRINKSLQELDDIANDNNIPQYARTQIWNLVSILEKF